MTDNNAQETQVNEASILNSNVSSEIDQNNTDLPEVGNNQDSNAEQSLKDKIVSIKQTPSDNETTETIVVMKKGGRKSSKQPKKGGKRTSLKKSKKSKGKSHKKTKGKSRGKK